MFFSRGYLPNFMLLGETIDNILGTHKKVLDGRLKKYDGEIGIARKKT